MSKAGTTRTFGAVLRRGMLVGGEGTAVVCGDLRLTHRELADRTRDIIDMVDRLRSRRFA